MGEHPVTSYSDPARLRQFMKHLLADLRALEHMLREGHFETDVRRIGAEQEMVLLDDRWHPAPVGPEVLERLDSDIFTTELGRFNLEFNLPPILLGGNCLRQLERNLNDCLYRVQLVAREFGAKVLLIGTLPTITKADLDLSNMTPSPRYFALNDAMRNLRGGDFEFRFSGTDELMVQHDSVMLEACNTSCQFHFQVAPDEFARYYNIAQVAAGPVLACATNSPLLFGRRLWHETRIALFQQAIDTRKPGHQIDERNARVWFGSKWVKDSVIEVFREDIARFRVLLAMDIDEDPFEELDNGRIPKLKALCMHNSTVYRWMRPCYGILKGKPHLRIENRVLPSGPTVADEVANAAFWFGLISGLARRYDNIAESMDFDDAKTNFLAAAKFGLQTHLTWLDGRSHSAGELISRQLVPIARDGLAASHIDPEDIHRYMTIIEERAVSGRTGAQWAFDSLSNIKKKEGTRAEQHTTVTAAAWTRQQKGQPVHEWSLATSGEASDSESNYQRVGQYMTTDVFTVHEDEVIDLVANVMDWERIRHVPVEDGNNRLVGLISYRQLLQLLAQDLPKEKTDSIPVRSFMEHDPITVTPDTSTLEAVEIMRSKGVACLPVVTDGQLVGIVTEHDFMLIAGRLLAARSKEAVQ